MIFRSLHLIVVITVAASSSVPDDQATVVDVDAGASLRRGLKKNFLRTNIFDAEDTQDDGPADSTATDTAIASNSASSSESSSPNPCKKYAPSSDERKLCNLLRSYFMKDEDEESEESEESYSSDDKSGICKKIDEIYDSIIVVDVIETAGLTLDDVLALSKYSGVHSKSSRYCS